ncbi:MAG: gag polymerase env [Lasallia pustulata]|uniref:Gag polymerase env n=1 Tax=Lasallia pustulata TaxID=136370 RepID=A0A5M8PKC7_9LECA|nr:MAG: gag polymerase env [Lasallia pustulata]
MTLNLTRRQLKWAEKLAGYNFNVTYQEGKKNPADGLSRRPDYELLKASTTSTAAETVRQSFWLGNNNYKAVQEKLYTLAVMTLRPRRPFAAPTINSNPNTNTHAISTINPAINFLANFLVNAIISTSIMSGFTAVNIAPGLSDFAAAAAGNGGDPPLTKKPIGLQAQCDKEGSGSESVDDFVVVNISGKRRGNGLLAIAPMISAPSPTSHYWYPLRASQPLLDELVAAMTVLPESTAHALRLLNAHQSRRRHKYIEFSERRHIEEMGSEASSDGEDGLETAGGE